MCLYKHPGNITHCSYSAYVTILRSIWILHKSMFHVFIAASCLYIEYEPSIIIFPHADQILDGFLTFYDKKMQSHLYAIINLSARSSNYRCIYSYIWDQFTHWLLQDPLPVLVQLFHFSLVCYHNTGQTSILELVLFIQAVSINNIILKDFILEHDNFTITT